MKSIILTTGVIILFPLFIFFSFFMLFRGHDEPGGGFIAGLMGASAFVFYGLAYEMKDAKKLLKVDALYVIAIGLALCFLGGLLGLLAGHEYLYPLWPPFSLPFIGTPGSPIVFDIGVYLTVVGSVLQVCFSLTENDSS